MIRNILYGIKNPFSWFWIVWKDRDWDYVFIYKLLLFKLNRMKEYLLKYGHSTDAEIDAESISVCIECLNRLLLDSYADSEWEALYKKWGEFEFVEHKLEVSGVKTEEDEKAYREDVHRCTELEEKLVVADLNLLFDTIRDNIRRWWD